MPDIKKGNWTERANKSKFFCYMVIAFIALFIFAFWIMAVVFDFSFVIGIRG